MIRSEKKSLTRMLAQYGEDCTGMKRKVYQRIERFQCDRKCITDEDCYG